MNIEYIRANSINDAFVNCFKENKDYISIISYKNDDDINYNEITIKPLRNYIQIDILFFYEDCLVDEIKVPCLDDESTTFFEAIGPNQGYFSVFTSIKEATELSKKEISDLLRN